MHSGCSQAKPKAMPYRIFENCRHERSPDLLPADYKNPTGYELYDTEIECQAAIAFGLGPRDPKSKIKWSAPNSAITAVMRSAFAVIPDAERLDIGGNKIIAVFKHRHQAEEWAKSMWENFYLIEEVQSGHF